MPDKSLGSIVNVGSETEVRGDGSHGSDMSQTKPDELRFQSCQFAHLDPEYPGWARERQPDQEGVRRITRRVTKYVAPGYGAVRAAEANSALRRGI